MVVGGDRVEAGDRIGVELDAFCVRGISHNIGFLHDIVASERFREGRLSTRFIEEEYPEGFDPTAGAARHATDFAAAAALLNHVRVGRDRKSVVEGKSVSVRVDLGGRRTIKKKKK